MKIIDRRIRIMSIYLIKNASFPQNNKLPIINGSLLFLYSITAFIRTYFSRKCFALSLNAECSQGLKAALGQTAKFLNQSIQDCLR